jgi:hypothetical protein
VDDRENDLRAVRWEECGAGSIPVAGDAVEDDARASVQYVVHIGLLNWVAQYGT